MPQFTSMRVQYEALRQPKIPSWTVVKGRWQKQVRRAPQAGLGETILSLPFRSRSPSKIVQALDSLGANFAGKRSVKAKLPLYRLMFARRFQAAVGVDPRSEAVADGRRCLPKQHQRNCCRRGIAELTLQGSAKGAFGKRPIRGLCFNVGSGARARWTSAALKRCRQVRAANDSGTATGRWPSSSCWCGENNFFMLLLDQGEGVGHDSKIVARKMPTIARAAFAAIREVLSAQAPKFPARVAKRLISLSPSCSAWMQRMLRSDTSQTLPPFDSKARAA